MDHDIIPQELDDLLSDIHQLIDEENTQPEAEDPSSEFVMPEQLQEELFAEEAAEEAPAPEPEEEEPATEEPAQEEPAQEEPFQQQRWTDRQKVPRHVAKLQHNQEEAYARWLQEQEGKLPEPPPEFPEEKPKRKKHAAEHVDVPESEEEKEPKRMGALGFIAIAMACIALLTVLAAAVFVPRQPKAPGDELRSRGVSTIVLAGTDESLAQTDLLMLLTVDAKDKKLAIISLPKDTLITTADGSVSLGSVYGRAGGGMEGISALKQAVGGCIGFEPDGALVLHPQSVVQFTDALGGVGFDLPQTVQAGDYVLPAGTDRLNGQEAYSLLSLLEEGQELDLDRLQLQQRFLAAAISQCASARGVMRAPMLLDALTSTCVTDLNTANLLWLGRTALVLDHSSVFTETIPGSVQEDTYVLQADALLETVNAYCSPYLRSVTRDDLEITDP